MVTRGWYRHYKGHVYFVYGVACLKHELERRIVIYTSVKTEQEVRFDFLARDEVDFERWVEPNGTEHPEFPRDDEHAIDHGLIRRFERITDPEKSIVPT